MCFLGGEVTLGWEIRQASSAPGHLISMTRRSARGRSWNMKNHGEGSVAPCCQCGAEQDGRNDLSLSWSGAHTPMIDCRLQDRASTFLEPWVMTLSAHALT